MTSRIPRRRVYHVKHGRPYHEENSRRGVNAAVDAGAKWIDLDCRITADEVLVITHWPRPVNKDGFKDPLDRLNRMRTVESMTWAEVQRLRTDDAYRIHAAEGLVQYALDEGLNVELELKTSAIKTRHLKQLHAALGDDVDLLVVKTLGQLPPKPWNRLRRAHKAGFTTLILGGGRRRRVPAVPRSSQPFIDYYRSTVKWV